MFLRLWGSRRSNARRREEITDIATKANALLGRFGYHVQRARPERDLYQLTALKAREYGVRTFLDIGANAGHFGLELRKNGWTGGIASFEPLPGVHQRLQDEARRDKFGNWMVPERMALGGEEGETTINVAENLFSSSLLTVEERSTVVAADSGFLRTEPVSVRRLDSVVDPSWERPFAIKVDTQGFEGEVLKGAAETLAASEVVALEMSLVPLYANAAGFAELFATMEAAGFYCIAMLEGFADHARHEVLQVDGVFVRKRPDIRGE